MVVPLVVHIALSYSHLFSSAAQEHEDQAVVRKTCALAPKMLKLGSRSQLGCRLW